jgi:AcrR family transcriptional regulator
MADLSADLGLASARIYAAFGSKEALFREAISLYNEGEGGFATRALAEEPTARHAIRRILEEAIDLYTSPSRPGGCMVVSSATNCASENAAIGLWLSDLRQKRTKTIVARIRKAVEEHELRTDVDPASLGEFFATVLHGISVQARDGTSKERLLAAIAPALAALEGVSEDAGD